jgi:hypothetical protein
MDSRENEEFTALLREAVSEAEKLKYRPTTFKRMLDEYGGFETVNRVLSSGKPSDGFTKLWELGRLNLTCEAIIVETKWGRYFDANVLAKAEKLLSEMRYPYQRYEELIETAVQAGQTIQTRASTETRSPNLENLVPEPLLGYNMPINDFFREVLNAPFANMRWSWGAVDERSRRVFFRLWRMDIVNWEWGQSIRVLDTRNTNLPGWKERAQHIELIKSGYSAYGVICDKDSPQAAVIRDFDRDNILHLGRVSNRDGVVYLEIARVGPVNLVAVANDSPRMIASDLRNLEEAEISATTRASLVDARLGQGRFRRELLRRWGGACAVTGCCVGAVLRASHCKPWRKSNNHERLDSNNGLILSANLDALFDAGLISFCDAGEMIVSAVLSAREQSELGVPARLLRTPNASLAEYLNYHRRHVFKG